MNANKGLPLLAGVVIALSLSATALADERSALPRVGDVAPEGTVVSVKAKPIGAHWARQMKKFLPAGTKMPTQEVTVIRVRDRMHPSDRVQVRMGRHGEVLDLPGQPAGTPAEVPDPSGNSTGLVPSGASKVTFEYDYCRDPSVSVERSVWPWFFYRFTVYQGYCAHMFNGTNWIRDITDTGNHGDTGSYGTFWWNHLWWNDRVDWIQGGVGSYYWGRRQQADFQYCNIINWAINCGDDGWPYIWTMVWADGGAITIIQANNGG